MKETKNIFASGYFYNLLETAPFTSKQNKHRTGTKAKATAVFHVAFCCGSPLLLILLILLLTKHSQMLADARTEPMV